MFGNDRCEFRKSHDLLHLSINRYFLDPCCIHDLTGSNRSALCGLGFTSPISCLVSVAQLADDPHYCGQMSGLMIALRSLGAALGPAICNAIFVSKITPALPAYISKAAVANGVPQASAANFVKTFLGGNATAIGAFPSVIATVISASGLAFKQAYAHSYHYLWASLAPWAVVALGCTIALANPRKLRTNVVDASVEPELCDASPNVPHDHVA